mmetsp:Transcript_8475/g.12376  ORF Transcript_8475/g.12376 Transcript_8475/m.12376 type:complete len:317 (+) Transcript_8475:1-951(+)
MASSTAIVRLAALSSRGNAPTAAAALSTSATSYVSSVPSIAASQNTLNQKRSHHYNASSSSTQFSKAQWNGCNQMNMSLRNSMHKLILSNNNINNNRWFSSKSDNEENQTSSDSQQAPSTTVEEAANTASGSSQHNTWVQFQQSIAVSGFETGQTVREKAFGKKSRGGKIDRKRKEREAELEAALRGTDNTQLKGGEFPSQRFSDEETERLLAQAYAAIPPRAGKRGTRNLKRQKNRWEIKRQYDATKKQERMDEHDRRMEKRHEISQAMYNIRVEGVDIRERDQSYQMDVMKRWADMNGHAASGNDEGGVAKMET